MPPIRQVRDEDGTPVPFRQRQIAGSVPQALLDGGLNDRALADELAGVVTLFLEREYQDPATPPTVGDIQDMIERVLAETGNNRGAKSFRRLRQQREELRNLITVRHRS